MTRGRLCAVWGVLLFVTVHVSGQQQQAGQTGAGSAGSGNVDRGRYLVESVAMCGECHSPRDAQGNVVAGMRFMGGAMPVQAAWPDWPLYIPRISGLPGYDDEQAVRLLTQGAIDRHGRQLRPPMPRFRMTPQDAADVVAYLRAR